MTKRQARIEVVPFMGTVFVITARCGCQFSMQVRGACCMTHRALVVERHLDFHEKWCGPWRKAITLAVQAGRVGVG